MYFAGFKVFGGARRLAEMADLKALGVHVFELDVTSDESVKSMYDEVAELAGGKLDFLFNNAGVSCTFPASDLTMKVVEDCFAVNFFGVVRVTTQFLPLLISAQGTVVQTSSIASKVAFPFGSMYAASKEAMNKYSDILRVEMMPFKVKVITLIVAAVESNIADTRPLPDGSIYYDIEDAVALRRSMAKGYGPMPADVFAKSIVGEVCVRTTTKETIWEGKGWLYLWFLANLLPTFLLRIMVNRQFGLNRLAEIVTRRQLKRD